MMGNAGKAPGKFVVFFFTGLFAIGMSMSPQMTIADEWDDAIQRAGKSACVGWSSICSVTGRFLVVQKNTSYCAIRFTSYRRGHDAKPATFFNSGVESLYAEYDWYYQGDGSGDLSRKNVVSGHSELSRKPTLGLGRIFMQTGVEQIHCGPIELPWKFPNGVGFNRQYRADADVGVRLAPTRWDRIEDVDVHRAQLRWYGFDENRETVYLPLNSLCCE